MTTRPSTTNRGRTADPMALAGLAYNVGRTLDAVLNLAGLVGINVRRAYAFEGAVETTVEIHVRTVEDVDQVAEEWNLPPDDGTSGNYTRAGVTGTGVEQHYLAAYTARPPAAEPEDCTEHLTITHDTGVTCAEALTGGDQ